VVVAYAVAVPVGAFLVLLWAVHAPIMPRPVIRPAVILTAALVVLILPTTVGWVGLATVVAAIALSVAGVVVVTLMAPAERVPA
jgi:hypothetical protein